MFFTPFIRELRDLVKPESGIWLKKGDQVKQVAFVAPMATTDLIAKAKVQKHHQFNGRFGCGNCLHPGVVIGKQVKYPVGEYAKRTHESMKADMYKAHELDLAGNLKKTKNSEDHVNGVLGLSPLLALPEFRISESFTTDYLHAILLGVTPKLLDLWEERKKDCIEEEMSLSIVDVRLKKLRPPSTVQEPPRPLKKRGEFKGKDYRSLLLFIC